jgi:hypothetical protein
MMYWFQVLLLISYCAATPRVEDREEHGGFRAGHPRRARLRPRHDVPPHALHPEDPGIVPRGSQARGLLKTSTRSTMNRRYTAIDGPIAASARDRVNAHTMVWGSA